MFAWCNSSVRMQKLKNQCKGNRVPIVAIKNVSASDLKNKKIKRQQPKSNNKYLKWKGANSIPTPRRIQDAMQICCILKKKKKENTKLTAALNMVESFFTS